MGAHEGETLIEVLGELLELKYRALAACEVAEARLRDTVSRAKLAEFRREHLEHIEDLRRELQALGGEPIGPADVGPTPPLLAGDGDRALLRAVRESEAQNSAACDRLLRRVDAPATLRESMARHVSDERRHRAWLAQRLEYLRRQVPRERPERAR